MAGEKRRSGAIYKSPPRLLDSAPEVVPLVDVQSSRAARTTPTTSTRRPRPDALAADAVDETTHWLRLRAAVGVGATVEKPAKWT